MSFAKRLFCLWVCIYGTSLHGDHPDMSRFSGAFKVVPADAKTLDSQYHFPTRRTQELQRFTDRFCSRCHGEKKQKGGFDTRSLKYKDMRPTDMDLWQSLLDTIHAGDMPPESSDQPSVSELTGFIADLSEELHLAREHFVTQKSDRLIRRLNNRELKNSIYELTGYEADLSDFPEDGRYHNFDTVSEALSISPFYLESTYEIAKGVMEKMIHQWNAHQKMNPSKVKPTILKGEDLAAKKRAVAKKAQAQRIAYLNRFDQAEKTMTVQELQKAFQYSDQREMERRVKIRRRDAKTYPWDHYDQYPMTQTGMIMNQHNGDHFSRVEGSFSIAGKRRLAPGKYKVSVNAGVLYLQEGVQMNLSLEVGGKKIGEWPVSRTPQEAEEVSFTFTHSSGKICRYQLKLEVIGEKVKRVNKRDPQPRILKENLLWLDQISIELDSGRVPDFAQQIFPNSKHQIQEKIEAFATQAFRGKTPDRSYLKRLVNMAHEHYEKHKSPFQAVMEPYAIIMSSPNFLYHVERSARSQRVSQDPSFDPTSIHEHGQRVNGLDYAQRLSFFLWSSPMDEEGLKAFHNHGSFSSRVVLQQVDRMMEHEKFNHFIDGFVSQWLSLERLDAIDVNRKKYPRYSDLVKHSSAKETKNYVHYLFDQNLRIDDLIDSNFVVVDEVMKSYYRMDVEKSKQEKTPLNFDPKFEVLKLPADSMRGGLLSQASILTMTSNGDRSSPVERGAFILHRFLNHPEMSPPPNVPQLVLDQGQQSMSVRQAMELHSSQPQCASCHTKIDPLGYGMESFGLDGQWRTRQSITVMKKGQQSRASKKIRRIPLQTEGLMPDGQRKFSNYRELLSHLMDDKDLLLTHLTKSLLVYALGRPVGFKDLDVVEGIVAFVKDHDYRLRPLLYAIAMCDPMMRSSS